MSAGGRGAAQERGRERMSAGLAPARAHCRAHSSTSGTSAGINSRAWQGSKHRDCATRTSRVARVLAWYRPPACRRCAARLLALRRPARCPAYLGVLLDVNLALPIPQLHRHRAHRIYRQVLHSTAQQSAAWCGGCGKGGGGPAATTPGLFSFVSPPPGYAPSYVQHGVRPASALLLHVQLAAAPKQGRCRRCPLTTWPGLPRPRAVQRPAACCAAPCCALARTAMSEPKRCVNLVPMQELTMLSICWRSSTSMGKATSSMTCGGKQQREGWRCWWGVVGTGELGLGGAGVGRLLAVAAAGAGSPACLPPASRPPRAAQQPAPASPTQQTERKPLPRHNKQPALASCGATSSGHPPPCPPPPP